MVRRIDGPTRIPVPGGKVIDELVGRVNSGDDQLSVAHMVAPPGWDEPPQVPEFTEVTYVLKGALRVEHEEGLLRVDAGQTVITQPGEKVRYSAGSAGAEYISICLPAFSTETVHREG